jgi:hypothetical protein
MSIKFIDPKVVIKVVSMNDEAIDRMNSDMVEYQNSYDINFLKFLEGQVPTYFVINNIGSADLVEIQQDHYITEMPQIKPGQNMSDFKNFKPKITAVRTGEMLVKYFKAGCKKVIDGSKEIEVNDEFINTIPSMVLQELGAFIMTRSMLNDTKKK